MLTLIILLAHSNIINSLLTAKNATAILGKLQPSISEYLSQESCHHLCLSYHMSTRHAHPTNCTLPSHPWHVSLSSRGIIPTWAFPSREHIPAETGASEHGLGSPDHTINLSSGSPLKPRSCVPLPSVMPLRPSD